MVIVDIEALKKKKEETQGAEQPAAPAQEAAPTQPAEQPAAAPEVTPAPAQEATPAPAEPAPVAEQPAATPEVTPVQEQPTAAEQEAVPAQPAEQPAATPEVAPAQEAAPAPAEPAPATETAAQTETAKPVETTTVQEDSNEDETENISKVFKHDDALCVKIPEDVVKEKDIKEEEYVVVHIKHPKKYVVEVENSVMELLNKFKDMPQYKDKDEGEILEEIMFKFHNKDGSEKVEKPKKDIQVVEKNS